jgi:hypothetical protein
MKVISRIRNLAEAGRFEITAHADEEAQEDDINISDIKNAIYTGKIIKKYTNDPRGTRYKITGKTFDNRLLNVIVRFNTLGEVRILTVFILRGKENGIW